MSEVRTMALASADERLRDWDFRCKCWYICHYAVGVAGIVLSAVIAGAARDDTADLGVLFWLAIAAAVIQGFTTFLGAQKKAVAYRAGWRTLWVATERLRSGVAKEPAEVYNAIERGWELLSRGEVDS